MDSAIDFQDDELSANIDNSLDACQLVNSPAKLPKKSDAEYGNYQIKKCREMIGEESREASWWAGMRFIDRMALINAACVGGGYQSRRSVAGKEWKQLSGDWQRGILTSVRRMCAWAKQKNI